MAVVLFYRQGFWGWKKSLKSQRQISKNPKPKFVKFMLKNSCCQMLEILRVKCFPNFPKMAM